MQDLSEQSFELALPPEKDEAELRVLCQGDITSAYIEGMNDPEVRHFVSIDRGVLNAQSVQGFVMDNWQRADCLLFGLFIAGVHRGNVRLHEYDGASIWLGIALFDRSIWGQGFGVRMILAASNFALNELSCLSVRAGVDRKNEKSVAVFCKAGFSILEEKPDGFVMVRNCASDLSHGEAGPR